MKLINRVTSLQKSSRWSITNETYASYRQFVMVISRWEGEKINHFRPSTNTLQNTKPNVFTQKLKRRVTEHFTDSSKNYKVGERLNLPTLKANLYKTFARFQRLWSVAVSPVIRSQERLLQTAHDVNLFLCTCTLNEPKGAVTFHDHIFWLAAATGASHKFSYIPNNGIFRWMYNLAPRENFYCEV